MISCFNKWASRALALAMAALVSMSLGFSQLSYDVHVGVNVSKPFGTLKSYGMGIGVAVWDAHMGDPVIPQLVKDAGFKVIRYPGGSYADIFHWRRYTGTVSFGGKPNLQIGNDFDSFMHLVWESETTPLITVNYGSNEVGTAGGDPQEAADWVSYANKTKGYDVKYWEIGNEVYGNGFYNGNPWEYDGHAPMDGKPADRLKNPKLGPDAYGANVNAYVRAMKAVDPTIKIGAVLTTPGGWPDGVDPDWNSNVLKECGENVDFVVIHWYGYGNSVPDELNSLRTVPGICSKVKALIAQYCGRHAKDVQIWMTEGDPSGLNMRYPGALFAADHFLTWWEAGASHVDWWNLHNGLSVDDSGGYDDQGLLSSGQTSKGVRQPPANTPFPPYYGAVMTSKLIQPGDQFLPATVDSPLVSAHAVLKKHGDVGLMIINRDPEKSAHVTVDLGVKTGSTGVRYDFGPASKQVDKSVAEGLGPTFTIDAPAYTITVVQIPIQYAAQPRPRKGGPFRPRRRYLPG